MRPSRTPSQSAVLTATLLALGVAPAALSLTGCSQSPEYTAQPATVRDAQVVAVKFHADWCGACKQLDGPVGELKSAYKGRPVKFLTVDLTNDSTKESSRRMLEQYNLDGLMDSYKATGYVLLIDAGTGAVITRLTTADSLDDMKSAIDKKLS